jgi:hypothetical protein
VARKVIYTHGGGRLGNQLLRAAHFQAYLHNAITSVEVVNLGLASYAQPLTDKNDSFWIQSSDGIRGVKFIGISASDSRMKMVQHYIRRYHEKKMFGYRLWHNFDEQSMARGGARESLVHRQLPRRLLCGWAFNQIDLLEKHYECIQEQFRIALNRCAGGISEKLIGIHIRHGDYKSWEGGRFYYTLDKYAKWIEQITERFGAGCTYAIVSDFNAKEKLAIPCGFDFRFSVDGATEIDDFITLSNCSVVVGPPSTFSTMAAFLGGAEYILLESESVNLKNVTSLKKPLIDMHKHPIGQIAVN